jgi:hypothetical protein
LVNEAARFVTHLFVRKCAVTPARQGAPETSLCAS